MALDQSDRAPILAQHRDRERIGLAAEALIERLTRGGLPNRSTIEDDTLELCHRNYWNIDATHHLGSG